MEDDIILISCSIATEQNGHQRVDLLGTNFIVLYVYKIEILNDWNYITASIT